MPAQHYRLTVKTLRLTVTSPLGAWGGGGGGRAFGKLCVPLKTSWLRPCALQSKEPSPGVTWIFFSVVAVCNMSEITHSSPFKDAGLQAEVYTSTLIVCWPLLQPVIIISQAINAKNLNYTELKPSRCRLLRLLSPPNSKINGLSLNLNIVRLNRSFFFLKSFKHHLNFHSFYWEICPLTTRPPINLKAHAGIWTSSEHSKQAETFLHQSLGGGGERIRRGL